MAALCPGVQYGLSSQENLGENKDLIFVKLTDSALRAIEEYIKNQVSAPTGCAVRESGQHTVRFGLDKSPFFKWLINLLLLNFSVWNRARPAPVPLRRPFLGKTRRSSRKRGHVNTTFSFFPNARKPTPEVFRRKIAFRRKWNRPSIVRVPRKRPQRGQLSVGFPLHNLYEFFRGFFRRHRALPRPFCRLFVARRFRSFSADTGVFLCERTLSKFFRK